MAYKANKAKMYRDRTAVQGEELAFTVDSDTDVEVFTQSLLGLDGNKTIAISNTGANPVTVAAKGAYTKGGTFPSNTDEQFEIEPDTEVAAGAKHEINIPVLNAYSTVQLTSRRTNAGQSSTTKNWFVGNSG